jgi:glycosyltransferase involved in cell wall biosynthesis
MLSIVIPIHNEEPSILPLYDRLTAVLEQWQRPYEILFVDDASTDRSFDLLANLVETDGPEGDPAAAQFRPDRGAGGGFSRSAGQRDHRHGWRSAARSRGYSGAARKIEEGYDIASGWRKNRVDNAVTRKFPSRIANWLMAKASGVDLRDFGTTFKAYRAEILKDVNLYGELHRFIPALASFYGARIAEVPIRNTVRGPRRVALRAGPDLPRDVRHLHHLVPA